MALKNLKTTADFLPWDKFCSLLRKLEKEEDYKFLFLVAIGGFLGLRISDIKPMSLELLMKSRFSITEKKTKKQRDLVVNDDLKRIIDLCSENCGVEKAKPFLSNKYGTAPISTQYINRRLKLYCKPYGIRQVSSHTLRKTFGREVWERDGRSERALIMLSDLFNHSSIAITRRYLGIRQEEFNDVYYSLAL